MLIIKVNINFFCYEMRYLNQKKEN